MVRFWVHTSSDTNRPLDGGGFPIALGELKVPPIFIKSAKLTVWSDKEAVLAFCKRKFKGLAIRDLGLRVEIDLPADPPIQVARTLAFSMVEIQNLAPEE